jgi:small GTP-binding protein
MDYNLMFKVMLVGDSSSGKEDLAEHYLSGIFHSDLKLTHGVDFRLKTIKLEAKIVRLQIWDLANEPRFRFFLPRYCKGASGALVIFDITNANTLDRLTEWSQTIREHAGDIPIMLVGNENILGKPREVLRAEAIGIAKKYNLSAYGEISTETGKGIERMFHDFTELILTNTRKI